SPQERRCVDLRSEGLRYREIAEILGVSLSTVQTFLTRALQKLMKEVDV
ncbi:MAG TPA: LuxR family transcriptional regulator, partial [Thermopetrobacter sp.]|nr:LuxR family transcriptional regulator [Thermopetrobacter sp.]